MKREFTASVYIMEENRTLLIHHKKLHKWLPPGGHIDLNETPPEAAIREAYEETGIRVELMGSENIWINYRNAASIQRPYLCLLEEIPAYQNQPAHQHIDFVFIGRPIGGTLRHNPNETNQIRWFSYDEISSLDPDIEIFQETFEILESVFKQFAPSQAVKK